MWKIFAAIGMDLSPPIWWASAPKSLLRALITTKSSLWTSPFQTNQMCGLSMISKTLTEQLTTTTTSRQITTVSCPVVQWNPPSANKYSSKPTESDKLRQRTLKLLSVQSSSNQMKNKRPSQGLFLDRNIFRVWSLTIRRLRALISWLFKMLNCSTPLSKLLSLFETWETLEDNKLFRKTYLTLLIPEISRISKTCKWMTTTQVQLSHNFLTLVLMTEGSITVLRLVPTILNRLPLVGSPRRE